MKTSKEAVKKFRNWFDNIILSYPVTKNGVVRSNCSRKNRIEIENSYCRLVNQLVTDEVRTVDSNEQVDITSLYIPTDLSRKIDKLFCSVEPMFIFYAPVNITYYSDPLKDTDVVIFGDKIIIPRRGRK